MLDSIRVPTIGSSDRRTLRRYLTFLTVLALHVALIVALVIHPTNIRLPMQAAIPVELLFLPAATPLTARQERALTNSPHPKSKTMVTAPSSANVPLMLVPAESKKPDIDWENEAQTVAAAATSGSAIRSFDHQSAPPPPAPSQSIFDGASVHHAGEELTTDDGQRAVFIRDNCYQVSNPFYTPNALENGKGLPTYCMGQSNDPRGDLFEQLSAYKKAHPSP